MSCFLSIVHMSDLHFGDKSRFPGIRPAELGAGCGASILDAVKKQFGKDAPDLVIVTGDIAEACQDKGFSFAKDFFHALQGKLGLARSRFVFLPGNHDLIRDACKKYFAEAPAKRTLDYDSRLTKQKFDLFDKFVRGFYGDEPANCLPADRRSFVCIWEDLRVVVAGLNSSERESDQYLDGNISREQVDSLDLELKKHDLSEYIRILALHYPISTSAQKARDWIEHEKAKAGGPLDRTRLDKLVHQALNADGAELVCDMAAEMRAHLVLHGHQHSLEGFIPHQWGDKSAYCQISPAGSFGAEKSSLPEDAPNCLRIFGFSADQDKVLMAAADLDYDPNFKAGRTRGRFVLSRRPVLEATYPLPYVGWPQSPPSFNPEESSTGDPDNELLSEIRSRLEEILATNPELCRALPVSDHESVGVAACVDSLLELGFEQVWIKVKRGYTRFRPYGNALKRILLLLVLAAVKGSVVLDVRQKLKATPSGLDIVIETRYQLISYLVLKAAMLSEVDVLREPSGAIVGRNYLPLSDVPRGDELGVDMIRVRNGVYETLLTKFRQKFDEDLKGLAEDERNEKLHNWLEAQLKEEEPFYLVHELARPVEIPYLPELRLASRKRPLAKEKVPFTINEETLLTFIGTILEYTLDTAGGPNQ